MRQLGLATCLAALLAAAAGKNACLDYTLGGSSQFKCVAGATTINLAGCGISAIDTQDLGTCFENAGQDSIRIIYLNNNAVSTLPAEVFQGLGALQALYLGGNPLTELDASLFGGLTSLERLWINGCPLTSLPAGLFNGLTGLEQLYLHNNELESLPDGLFGDDLDALHLLDLRQNALVTLPAASFKGLEGLRTLNLSANNLSSLPAGHFPTTLWYLFLSDNELGQGAIDSRAFEGLRELKTLALSNNDLETLPRGLFEDLEALTVLGLAGNSDLQCLPSTVGSPSLVANKGKTILPVGFASMGICSCPGNEVCDDCVEGQAGYVCTGCGEKAAACQLDRTCQECRIPPANAQEQASWDACLSKYGFRATCSALSASSCCFDELSANECLQNDAFVSYSTCLVDAVSEDVCTSLSCLQAQSNAFSSEEGTSVLSGAGRLKNAFLGWVVASSVTGLVAVAGTGAWA